MAAEIAVVVGAMARARYGVLYCPVSYCDESVYRQRSEAYTQKHTQDKFQS